MKSRRRETIRRRARWGAGLLLFPVGLLTLVLFCLPGEVEPSRFVPIDQLPFSMSPVLPNEENESKPFLAFVTPSGRCIVASRANEVPAGETRLVFDTLTKTHLETVSRWSQGSGLPLDQTPDKKQFAYFANDRLHLKNLTTGTDETVNFTTPWGEDAHRAFFGGGFSPDGRLLLIRGHDNALVYDLTSRRTASTFEKNGSQVLFHCFFDARGRPRALVINTDLDLFEIWDLASNQMILRLDQSELKRRGLEEPSFRIFGSMAAGKALLATAHPDGSLILVRSLEDGRFLQTFSLPDKKVELLRISANDGFLVFGYEHENPFVELTKYRIGWLHDWLQLRLPSENRLGVIELHTGKIWRNLPGEHWCAFTDDDLRFISFTEEGSYEYDLPLRRHAFTLWAWAALAACLSLLAAWWRLRSFEAVPSSH